MNAKTIGRVAIAVLLAVAGCKNQNQQAATTGASAVVQAAAPASQQPDANGVYPDGTLAKGHSAFWGTVKAAGQPLENVHVTVSQYVSEGQRPVEKEVWTDKNGEYRVFVPTGTYYIGIAKDGYQHGSTRVETQDKMYSKSEWTMVSVKETERQQAEQEERVRPIRILHSLNYFDVQDRCGEAQYQSGPAIAMMLAYRFPDYTGRRTPAGMEDGEVELDFPNKSGDPRYASSDFRPAHSNHDHHISDEEVVKYLPCLLVEGIAK